MLCRIRQARSVLLIKYGLNSYLIPQDLGLSQEDQCFGLSKGQVRLAPASQVRAPSSKAGKGTSFDICGPLVNQGTGRFHVLRTIRADGNNIETLFSSSLELRSTGYFLSDEEQCLAVQRGSRSNQEVLTMLIYQHAGAGCHSAPRRIGSLTSWGRKL